MDTNESTSVTVVTVVSFSLLAAVWITGVTGDTRPPVEVPPPDDLHAEHAPMVEEMRSEVTPQMVEEMNEPQWRDMRDPAMIAQMEAHQRQVDRMLGRR